MDESRAKKVFVENLKYYMELRGEQQKTAAAYCGVSTGTFSDWIRGRAYPRVGKMQKLADFLHVEISDLIEERSYQSSYFLNKEAKILQEDLVSDADAVEIYHAIKKLSPTNREIVKSLLKSLNKEE